MKKVLLLCTALLLSASLCLTASAALTDYVITASTMEGGQDVSYINVVIGTPHDIYFTLTGLPAATPTPTARLNVTVTPPMPMASAQLIYVDGLGIGHDVAAAGHWGPASGFAVSSATNETIKLTGTFDTLGQYDVTLTLVGVVLGREMTTKTLIVNVIEGLQGMTLTPAARTISVGEVFKLKAEPVPSTASLPPLVWSSNGPGIATVDQFGNVTGVSAGKVVITARSADGTLAAHSLITVTTGIPKTGGGNDAFAAAVLLMMAMSAVVLRVGIFRKKDFRF
ncbi:MAG: Ig-like domain-containing protein [Oscillospiraceae bacterium]|nr:Ig-like domain-containing protein [Oscillospiraceae bacterium]